MRFKHYFSGQAGAQLNQCEISQANWCRGHSSKLQDKACIRKKRWPKKFQSLLLQSKAEIYYSFTNTDISSQDIKTSSGFVLPFRTKKGIPQNKQNLFHYLQAYCFYQDPASAAAIILLQSGKRPLLHSLFSLLSYLGNSAACRKTWNEGEKKMNKKAGLHGPEITTEEKETIRFAPSGSRT